MQFDDPDLLSLREAAEVVPGSPSPSTLWRWAMRGHKGVRLEHLCIGGKLFTSRRALQNFFEQTTSRQTRQPKRNGRAKRLDAVDEQLRSLGFKI